MLINKTLLAKYSPLPRNYDYSEVEQFIDVAELIWIEPIIGSEFYDELKEQVAENNISEENATLLVEAIYPYLGFATTYEALPICWANFSQVGVTKGKSENSDSLTLKDMTYISQHLRSQVEVRKDFLIKFLNDHADSFPLYNPSCNCGCNSCNTEVGKLNKPNKNQQLYSTRRVCVELR